MKREYPVNIKEGAIWEDIIDVIHYCVTLEKWATEKYKSLIHNLIPLTTVTNTSFATFNHNNTDYLKTWTVYVEKKLKL